MVTFSQALLQTAVPISGEHLLNPARVMLVGLERSAYFGVLVIGMSI